MEINKTKREGVYLGGKVDKFGLTKDNHFMEVTKWDNLDGYTISMLTELEARTIELSWEELEGIKYLISRLDNE